MQGIFNLILSGGIDLNWILRRILKMTFIDFKRMNIQIKEHFVFVRFNPGFNIVWQTNPLEMNLPNEIGDFIVNDWINEEDQDKIERKI